MSGPLEELQFTEEEIDHGVKALVAHTPGGVPEAVRAVLRAVRAVPARCLNGGLAGVPVAAGATAQGVGLGGVRVRGWVVWSYPVTTCLRTPNGDEAYVWTNTACSWDPSTERVDPLQELLIGPPSTGKLRVGIDPRYLPPEMLRADDDGMPCEEGR